MSLSGIKFPLTLGTCAFSLPFIFPCPCPWPKTNDFFLFRKCAASYALFVIVFVLEIGLIELWVQVAITKVALTVQLSQFRMSNILVAPEGRSCFSKWFLFTSWFYSCSYSSCFYFISCFLLQNSVDTPTPVTHVWTSMVVVSIAQSTITWHWKQWDTKPVMREADFLLLLI